ncbi:hypothetical protein QUW02_09600, partial [Bacteroides eggerthii]|nr:hypothetical protein [Bacteroides eggerthii]
NRTYGGVRGRKTKVGRKLLRFPPTRFSIFADIKVTDRSFFIKSDEISAFFAGSDSNLQDAYLMARDAF